MSNRYAVILAAGKGTRMLSQRPKPLMKICGTSMLRHVLRAVDGVELLDRTVVVIGYEAELLEAELSKVSSHASQLVSATQPVQRGTGDAVSVALTRLPDLLPGVGGSGSDVLVLPSDTPLVSTRTLVELCDFHDRSDNAATILSMVIDDPTGYGRVLRNQKGAVTGIVEERDLRRDQRKIKEVGTAIYVFDLSVLPVALRRIAPTNSQGEYYLTDAIGLLAEAGHKVDAMVVPDPSETRGVNDIAQLIAAEEAMRRQIIDRHIANGVMMVRPDTITIDADVEIGAGSTIWPNSLILGSSTVGAGCEIGPGSRLVDTVVGAGSRLAWVDSSGARIGAGVEAGPYISLLEGVTVPDGSRVEPFSLIK